MFLAGILIKIESNTEIREYSFYQTEKVDYDKKEILGKIREFFSSDPDVRNEYLFRFQGKKIIARKVDLNKPGSLFIYCLIMEKSSPSELFLIEKEKDLMLLASSIEKGATADSMKMIVENKAHIIEKLHSVKALTTDVTKKATELIENDKINEYQKLLKLTQELPEKIVQNSKKAEAAIIEKNYRMAERSYKEAADMANQVYEYALAEFLIKKAETIGELPDLEKEIKSNYSEIVKIQGIVSKWDLSLFNKAYSKVQNLIKAYDQLENDEKIDKLQELSDELNKARDLAKKLEESEKIIFKKIEENA
jgi:hypothetical protein